MDDDNPPGDNPQHGNQINPSKNPSDSKSYNNNNYQQFECEKPVRIRNNVNVMERRNKIALVLYIIIILFVGADIIIEVCCKIYKYK